jgi:hypothetical protein
MTDVFRLLASIVAPESRELLFPQVLPVLQEPLEPDMTDCLEKIKREKSPAELHSLLNQVGLRPILVFGTMSRL